MKAQSILLAAGVLLQLTMVAEAQSLREGHNAVVNPEAPRLANAAALIGEYVIGREDLLAVNVWKEPEISRTVAVRPDGMITLPLIGDVEAGGSTPKQVQTNIRMRLEAYISNPEVTVMVQEVRSLKFNIVGEVVKPGLYPLSRPMTVLDGIALAGGLRDFAKQNRIYVLRVGANGTLVRIPFSYKDVIKAKKRDLELQSRDTVVVP